MRVGAGSGLGAHVRRLTKLTHPAAVIDASYLAGISYCLFDLTHLP
jgi:hypothetical protein